MLFVFDFDFFYAYKSIFLLLLKINIISFFIYQSKFLFVFTLLSSSDDGHFKLPHIIQYCLYYSILLAYLSISEIKIFIMMKI